MITTMPVKDVLRRVARLQQAVHSLEVKEGYNLDSLHWILDDFRDAAADAIRKDSVEGLRKWMAERELRNSRSEGGGLTENCNSPGQGRLPNTDFGEPQFNT